MAGAAIVYALREDLQQPDDPLPDPFRLCDAQQFGIGFQYVQMRIHAEDGVHVAKAQAHVVQQLPVACERFDVPAGPGVEGVGLERLESAVASSEAEVSPVARAYSARP